jgi:hypothetical protein
MKSLNSILTLAAASLLFAGCGKDSTPQTPAQTPEANAAANSGNPLVNAKKTADKTVDAAALNQAVQLFNVQEGRFPKTLQELVPNYIPKIPDAPVGYKINYDAAKGEVTVVRQ